MIILDALKQLRDDIKTWVTNNLNALNAKIDEKTISVDRELSSTSTNPVQNKVIKKAIDNIPTFSGDYNDLTNAPDISEDGSGNMVIADESGNIIFKADTEGIHTTAVSLNGEAAATEKYVDDAVANIPTPDVSGQINAHNINTEAHADIRQAIEDAKEELSESIVAESDEWKVVDNNGNIIFSVDAEGAHTTELTLNGETAATEAYVNNAIANIDIPEVDFTGYATEKYVNDAIAAIPETDFTGYATEDFVTTTVDSAKEELSESIVAESDEWKVVDEAGNIIFSVDATGAHTTELTLNGESVATESYVDNAIGHIEFPTTDLTEYATKKYVDDAVDGVDFTGYATETYVDNKVADLVNAAPEALDTLGELAVALEVHEDAYDALLETVGGKATHTDLENLKEELSESIVSEADEWKVVDEAGNIIFSVDIDGAHTTSMTLNNGAVATEEYVDNAIANITIPEPDLGDYATIQYVDDAVDSIKVPAELWEKVEGEAGIRLKGTNGIATGNQAISAGDDKTASDGTVFQSVASGDHAVAFGYGNTCSGRTTLAQGLYNTISANDAVAFGQRNMVNGAQSLAAGQQNEITGRISVALGYQNKAANTNCFVAGYKNTASASGAIAIGDTCESNGVSAVAMGYHTTASGEAAVTFGKFTKTTGAGEVAMGEYNQSTTSTNPAEQTAFSFGKGTSDTARKNAFEIKKNGDVYFNGNKFNPESTDLSNYYTKTEIDTAIKNAKEELSESIVAETDEWKVVDENGNIIFSVDATGAHTTSMTLNGQSVKDMIDDKVDKVDGKGLSTNDFTNEYKEKLDGLENMTFEESDPTVPAWAKEETKPSYTADEVGALSKDTPLFSGDYNDLENAPDISEDGSGDLIIADANGNIIFRSNGNGFETVNLTVENITINGKTIQEMIKEYVNEAILGGSW